MHFAAYLSFSVHIHTLEASSVVRMLARNKSCLPGVGLMGLHPLVARPRPRWWTSDSELWGSKKLTVRCWKLGDMVNTTDSKWSWLEWIVAPGYYKWMHWNGADSRTDKWGNDFASSVWQRLFASCLISKKVSSVANELGKHLPCYCSAPDYVLSVSCLVLRCDIIWLYNSDNNNRRILLSGTDNLFMLLPCLSKLSFRLTNSTGNWKLAWTSRLTKHWLQPSS